MFSSIALHASKSIKMFESKANLNSSFCCIYSIINKLLKKNKNRARVLINLDVVQILNPKDERFFQSIFK